MGGRGEWCGASGIAASSRTAGRDGHYTSRAEHGRRDPKDGELCLGRAKPEETLVEARSRSDVQIDGRTWVWGRKTNRTI